MKRFYLLILLCLPLSALADFSICDNSKSWRVCDDVNAASVSVQANTEIVELTTVTGENTLTGPDLVLDAYTPKNDGYSPTNEGFKLANLPYETGWQNS